MRLNECEQREGIAGEATSSYHGLRQQLQPASPAFSFSFAAAQC